MKSIVIHRSKCKLFWKCSKDFMRLLTYWPHAMNNNVPHFHPAFQGEDFKQRQHSVSHIVKIKIPRICPAIQKAGHSMKLQLKAPCAQDLRLFPAMGPRHLQLWEAGPHGVCWVLTVHQSIRIYCWLLEGEWFLWSEEKPEHVVVFIH